MLAKIPTAAPKRSLTVTRAGNAVPGVNPPVAPAPLAQAQDALSSPLGIGLAAALGGGLLLGMSGKKEAPPVKQSGAAVVRATAAVPPALLKGNAVLTPIPVSGAEATAKAELEMEIAQELGISHGPLYYTTVGSSKFHNAEYMKGRTDTVAAHFPGSLGIDDFMNRAEVALYQNGFSAENSIAMSNLCRDEVCIALKDKIDGVFGWSFNTVGLGGVITCGVTGMKAGLSHSPVEGAKERYVFFSMPHIAIDSKGNIGAIERPGRPGESCACGAMKALQGYFNKYGVEPALAPHMCYDDNDPELSVLRTRLAKKIKASGKDTAKLTLVDVTKECERMIAADLEDLISKAVNTKNADYAVITGVQVHNWSTADDGKGAPNLEFVQPVSAYVVVDGVKKDIDLSSIPPMTPRQVRLLAKADTMRRGWM